jgi:hypothetical protein
LTEWVNARYIAELEEVDGFLDVSVDEKEREIEQAQRDTIENDPMKAALYR